MNRQRIYRSSAQTLVTLLVGLMVLGLLTACAAPTPALRETREGMPEQATLPSSRTPAPPGAPAQIKMGIVTFLSGGGAPFGVPSRNAAEVIIEALNAGQAPAPYDQVGIGGVPIQPVYVDEAGGSDKQIAEYRRLVLDEKVDLVLGYVSSGTCLAVAPVAEELQTLTVFYTCATRRLFEEGTYRYIFRTKGTDLVYNVGAARYLLKVKPELQTIAGINQNYAWGQDSWSAFRDAVLQLKPNVRVVGKHFPRLFAGEYSAEISALLSARPDAIHSSFWGSDLETLVSQAAARGVFEQSTGVFVIGEAMLPTLGADVPPGLIVGAEGTHGALAPDNELNRWFVPIYIARYEARPIHTAYHMALTILGVKAAYEKAIADSGGRWPTTAEVIASFEHLRFDTPSGEIKMALANGHQAVEPMAFAITGEFDPALAEVRLTDRAVFPAECVNPPEGMTSLDWIAQGFPGAECP